MASSAAAARAPGIEALVELVQSEPGITATELASELHVGVDLLIALRKSLEAVTDDRQLDEDPAVAERWGSRPSPGDLASARAAGEAARSAGLASVLDGALSRDQAAGRLGISAQAVSERLKARTLTAVRRGREWRLPAWQFGDDAALPGLKSLIAAWPGTALSLSAWATKPSPDLGGRSPAAELARRDGAARVLELVEAIGATGW
jgi:hypothetical protein